MPQRYGNYSAYQPYQPRVNPEDILRAYYGGKETLQQGLLQKAMTDEGRRYQTETQQRDPNYLLNLLKLKNYPEDRELDIESTRALIGQRTRVDEPKPVTIPDYQKPPEEQDAILNWLRRKKEVEHIEPSPSPTVNQWQFDTQFYALPELQPTFKVQQQRDYELKKLDKKITETKMSEKEMAETLRRYDAISEAMEKDSELLAIHRNNFLKQVMGKGGTYGSAIPRQSQQSPAENDLRDYFISLQKQGYNVNRTWESLTAEEKEQLRQHMEQ